MSALLFEPMLATTTKRVAEVPEGWVAERKLDGWRAIVVVDDGRPVVWSRRGTDLTTRLPELNEIGQAVPDGTVLDGELVAGDGRASDFASLGPRLLSRLPAARARWAAVSVSFHVFDVLQVGCDNVCGAAWHERRSILEGLRLEGDAWATVPLLDGMLADLVSACIELDFEGVVLKRRESIYLPGERTKDWLKVKTPGWREHHGFRD